jgi:hypothetical protein
VADYNGRIGAIVRAFEKNPPGSTEIRFRIRETLRAEHLEGWREGYSDGLDDQYQGNKAEQEAAASATRFGDLDEDGHLTPDAEGHDMWTIAAWLPKGREAEVAEFLASHGIEVYRIWQAKPDAPDNHPSLSATGETKEDEQ